MRRLALASVPPLFAILLLATSLRATLLRTTVLVQAQANPTELAAAAKLSAAGEFSEAIAAYQQYLSMHPQSESAELALADCYRRVHNLEAARNVLKLARRQHPRSISVLKALGSLEIEDQRWDAAIETLRTALALFPQDLETRNLLGSAYQGKNAFDSALAEFNRVLARDSQNQLAHYFRAQVLADQGENEKALADAEAVVNARPNYLPGRVLLAKILVRQKQCRRAVETLQAAHAADQLDAQALFILANAHDCAGQPEQAKTVREQFAAAQQAEHQHTENEVQSKHLVEKANELARQNKFAEAVDLLRQAVEKNPENAFAYSQKAKILFSQGDVAGARAAITQALALQPFQPDFLYVEGIIAKQEGKLDEALAAFAKAVLVNPKESDAFFEMGKIRLQQGNRAAALAAFKKAAALDPADPDYQRAVKTASAPQ